MFEVKFADKTLQFDSPITAYDAAREAELISREVIAAKVNGTVCDLTTLIEADASVELLTFADDEGAHVFRHTASHVLAAAVKRLYPDAKLTIGPAIDNGFYYDFDSDVAFTPEILEKIEAEMKKVIKENPKLEKYTLPRAEALEFMKDEPYKVELINDLPEDAVISFYKMGDFTDLCAGPHLFSAGAIKAFKLTSCTGAYWRGDASRKMLQRIYGTAFPAKDALKAYLEQVEEARKRDHNKLGRELELFTTVDCIGQGLPILLPKGTAIIQKLQRWIEDEEERRGYLRTKTPLMAKRDLYRIPGHWDHYRVGMYILGDPDDESAECFALRPMTCPFQYQAYLTKKRSYRELPLRYGETSTLFRNEDSGEMHGLIRVRQFTISEGHLVLRPDQLEDEFRGCFELANYCLETLGLKEDCSFRFSQWDPNNTAKYEGTAEQWDHAQGVMKKILDDLGIDYKIGIDEAAFYGPKLDIQCKNVFGKEDTIVTIQIDMLLAEKFGMYYTDSNDQQKLPYIIHRTSMGCYERTLALLIEKYAGAFPMWLCPLQVEVIPIGADFNDYAWEVTKKLEAAGIKVHCDDSNDTMRYKIRQAQLQKTPYMLVVGERDMQNGTVSVRTRAGEDKGAMPTDEFIAQALMEIATKKR